MLCNKKWSVLLAVLVIGSTLLAACAAPPPEVVEVEVTREIQVEGETKTEKDDEAKEATGDGDEAKTKKDGEAGDTDDGAKTYSGLLTTMKSILGDRVKEVRLTDRLTDSPVCLVSGEHDPGANLERIVQAHTGGTGLLPTGARILELNGKHTLVRNLRALADKPDLVLVTLPDLPDARVFQMPALAGSWSRCLDGLEHPYSKRIRPITFDHATATGRDDVVLVHLNHPLVQMSLRLLRAEVWARDDVKRLHRVTVRTLPDAKLDGPAVAVVSRLVITGGNHHRLHEEPAASQSAHRRALPKYPHGAFRLRQGRQPGMAERQRPPGQERPAGVPGVCTRG